MQWALYYPVQVAWRDLPAGGCRRAAAARDGFERLRARRCAGRAAGVPGERRTTRGRGIGASMALPRGRRHRPRAGDAVDRPLRRCGDAEVERRAQLAAVALATGDVARRAARSTRRWRRTRAALRAARAAVVDRAAPEPSRSRRGSSPSARSRRIPQSVGALVAASEAAQGQFDLAAARAYLDRAIALDPRDVHALVNRARIRFGTDDTRGARQDADRAAAIAADDPQVRSLRGFIRLGEGDAVAARAPTSRRRRSATRSSASRTSGSASSHFRDDRVDDGLLEMLTATLLEPKVALYQSYLGKAYYQARPLPRRARRRSPRPSVSIRATRRRGSTRASSSATRTSRSRRSTELRQAIALNDHRAVYRSRLLLDRDLATKNVSLAEIYRQLGFEAWGAFEALNSLDADLTNSSAHLFLAETYGGLPDRTAGARQRAAAVLSLRAGQPQFLQQLRRIHGAARTAAQPARRSPPRPVAASARFGNVAHRSRQRALRARGLLPGCRARTGRASTRDDDRLQGFFQGKLSFTPRSDLFVSFTGVRSEHRRRRRRRHAHRSATIPSAPSSCGSSRRRPDPTETNRFHSNEVDRRRQAPVACGLGADRRRRATTRSSRPTSVPASFTSLCEGSILRSAVFELGARAQRQHAQSVRRVRCAGAAGDAVRPASADRRAAVLTQDKATRCSETITIRRDPTRRSTTPSTAMGTTPAQLTYVRDEIQLASWLHATVGRRLPAGQATTTPIDGRDFDVEPMEPAARTVAARLTPSTLRARCGVSAAAHQLLRVEHRAADGLRVRRRAQRVSHRAARRIQRVDRTLGAPGVRRASAAFVRDDHGAVPARERAHSSPRLTRAAPGVGVYVNWIAARSRDRVRRQPVRAVRQRRVRSRRQPAARLGINLIHPRGVFVRVAASHVTQRFANTRSSGLPRSGFTLADLRVGYEFARQARAARRSTSTNAFNRALRRRHRGPVGRHASCRDAASLASLRWRLW